jgi:energy-converting hydrogenase Eha subunit E
VRSCHTSKVVFLAVGSFVAVVATIYTAITPGYSDAMIRASIPDTVGVSSMWTTIQMVTFALITLAALAVAIRSKAPANRFLAAGTVVLALRAAAIAFHAHVDLAARATTLTGQQFGACGDLC